MGFNTLLRILGFNIPMLMWDDGEEESVTTTSTPSPVMAPEFPEAKAARENWWSTLQDWQKGGNWGLNMPDYNKVYDNAARKINQYYWGGSMGGGLMNKIKASAAARGVSDSPAADILKGRLGVEQAGQLSDLSSNLDVTKADALEKARINWLTSMTNLSGMKPDVQWGGTETRTRKTPQESLLPALIEAGVGLAGNYMMGSSLENLYGKPTMTQSSLTGGNSWDTGANDWANLGSMFF